MRRNCFHVEHWQLLNPKIQRLSRKEDYGKLSGLVIQANIISANPEEETRVDQENQTLRISDMH